MNNNFDEIITHLQAQPDTIAYSLQAEYPHLIDYLKHHNDNNAKYKTELPPFSSYEKKQISQEVDWCSNLNLFMRMLGIRITQGTVISLSSIPPSYSRLTETANFEYNQFLTHVARALSKHAGRCHEGYWGKISGSPEEQNINANGILQSLLEHYTWWNIYSHSSKGEIFEMRDHTGHGMRWLFEPLSFLGLVEPVDPYRGRLFFNSNDEFKRYLALNPLTSESEDYTD